MKKITEKNFEKEIEKGLVLVDFFATWCGPCRMMSSILEENSSLLKDVKVLKVDVDEEENLAKKFGVMMIPTLILFKDGKEIEKHVGIWQIEELLDTISENK